MNIPLTLAIIFSFGNVVAMEKTTEVNHPEARGSLDNFLLANGHYHLETGRVPRGIEGLCFSDRHLETAFMHSETLHNFSPTEAIDTSISRLPLSKIPIKNMPQQADELPIQLEQLSLNVAPPAKMLKALKKPIAFAKKILQKNSTCAARNGQQQIETKVAMALYFETQAGKFPELKNLLDSPESALQLLDAALHLNTPGLKDWLLYLIIDRHSGTRALKKALMQAPWPIDSQLIIRLCALGALNEAETDCDKIKQFYAPAQKQARAIENANQQAHLNSFFTQGDLQNQNYLFLALQHCMNHSYTSHSLLSRIANRLNSSVDGHIDLSNIKNDISTIIEPLLALLPSLLQTPVTSLNLRSNELIRVPQSLTQLVDLQEIDLSFNTLERQSLAHFEPLINLKNLDLSYCKFGDQVPSVLGKLVNLETLNLNANNFSGQIPQEFLQLQKLQVLCLAKNMLSGEIPEILGDLKELRRLDLSLNNFAGAIPQTLLSSENLEYLNISKNNLYTWDTREKLKQAQWDYSNYQGQWIRKK